MFKRNAENETDVWNSDLMQNIFTIDSLIEVRGLTGDNVFPCGFFDIDTEEWYNQYENEKQYLLDISLNYPPQLPRIRRWLRHIDEKIEVINILDDQEQGYRILTDSNKVDLLNLSQVFSTLEKSWVGAENEYPIMQQEDFFEKLANAKEEANAVPLAILNMNINRLKPDAIESGVLSFEEGVLNPMGEPDDYLERINWLIASPLSLQLIGKNQKFRVDRELYVQHQSKNIESIALDFGNGDGFIELEWDDVITVDYEEIGEKEIVVRVTYEDCSFAYGQSIIEVIENNNVNQRFDYENEINDDEFF